MDGSVLLHHDENESETNPDDILVRRLKNRERQRRYRARKRHEADRRKVASHVEQSTPRLHYQEMISSDLLSVPVEVEISLNLTSTDRVTRVHCPRDWKRDARGAHILKKCEPDPVGPSNSGAGTLSETFSECESKSDNNATNLSQSSQRDWKGRDWKAEARNRKSLD